MITKLKQDQIDRIKQLAESGMKQARIAELAGVSQYVVWCAVNGKYTNLKPQLQSPGLPKSRAALSSDEIDFILKYYQTNSIAQIARMIRRDFYRVRKFLEERGLQPFYVSKRVHNYESGGIFNVDNYKPVTI